MMDPSPARPFALDSYAGTPAHPPEPAPGPFLDRVNGAPSPGPSQPPQQLYPQQPLQYYNPSQQQQQQQQQQHHHQQPLQQPLQYQQPQPHQQLLQQQQQQYVPQQQFQHQPAPDHNGAQLAPVASPTRPPKFREEWDAATRGSSIMDAPAAGSSMQRSNSITASVAGAGTLTGDGTMASLSRGNTLKKKASLRRSGSLRRSSSRRSMKAGSVRSLALQSAADPDEIHSAFFCPVPTSGSPTEALAARFQAWRKILKDLITYYREIQTHYEQRSKSLLKLANVLNNISTPPGFLASGGLDDALQILRNYNRSAIADAAKAREIEEDVILALTGLRSDLHQKIKEIKNLSGDFKNSVDKEMDNTRRAVNNLQEVLGQTELDPSLTTGKQDPYLLRLLADRQLERQIDEENYLHQAYLNLENSGRELESIVVGEIQKSYNAYAGVLKREADTTYASVEDLRLGPISMPKDHEWAAFIARNDQFVNPEIALRSAEFIQYPGRNHSACQEIRAGLLERKGKYLKSYSPGWYVLSPTHLHEFKSADKAQAPVMSLYLPTQVLGSHSAEGASSNKFILKGRQTGTMHRGHTWVFRAESHDTMMAWYEDIKALTEGKMPEESSKFLHGHARSLSRGSQRSVSSDGVVDEDDDVPFSAKASVIAQQQQPRPDAPPRRPSPGGRFPSDIEVNAQRGLQVPVSPLSVGSDLADHDVIAAAVALPGSALADAESLHPGPGSGPQDAWANGAGAPAPQAHANAYNSSQESRGLVQPGPQPVIVTTSPAHSSAEYAGASSARQQQGAGPVVAVAGMPHTDAAQRPGMPSHLSGATSSGLSSDSSQSGFGFGQAALAVQTPTAVPGANGAPVPAAATQNGAAAKGVAYGRPAVGARNDSGAPSSISNLHVPGEFPKGTPLA